MGGIRVIGFLGTRLKPSNSVVFLSLPIGSGMLENIDNNLHEFAGPVDLHPFRSYIYVPGHSEYPYNYTQRALCKDIIVRAVARRQLCGNGCSCR
jgi:hypothetical protein